jgi:hypothetical protein
MALPGRLPWWILANAGKAIGRHGTDEQLPGGGRLSLGFGNRDRGRDDLNSATSLP